MFLGSPFHMGRYSDYVAQVIEVIMAEDMNIYVALTQNQSSTACELAEQMKADVGLVAITLGRLFHEGVVDKMIAQYCAVCGKREVTWWARRSPFKKVQEKYDLEPAGDDEPTE